MTASTCPSAPRGRPWYLLLAFTTLLTATAWVRADEVPLLRQGLWEYQRSAGEQRFAATECIDPSEELRREHAAQARLGCKPAPVLREGTSYTYAAECEIELPAGVATFSTTSVLTAESETAYRIERRLTSHGETRRELITAQRVADCAN